MAWGASKKQLPEVEAIYKSRDKVKNQADGKLQWKRPTQKLAGIRGDVATKDPRSLTFFMYGDDGEKIPNEPDND